MQIKLSIIYNILQFTNTGDLMNKDKAIDLLLELASIYRIKNLRATSKMETLELLANFTQNDKGYILNIPFLLNNLKNI